MQLNLIAYRILQCQNVITQLVSAANVSNVSQKLHRHCHVVLPAVHSSCAAAYEPSLRSSAFQHTASFKCFFYFKLTDQNYTETPK